MADVRTPSSLQDQASLSSPARAQTLPSEAVFDALKMILLGTPLDEILTSVTRLIEAQSEGMLCSIFLVEEDGLHLRYAGAPFRATFATWHLWAGVDLRTVQLWLGHKDMESTMRYLKPARSQAVREKVNATFA